MQVEGRQAGYAARVKPSSSHPSIQLAHLVRAVVGSVALIDITHFVIIILILDEMRRSLGGWLSRT